MIQLEGSASIRNWPSGRGSAAGRNVWPPLYWIQDDVPQDSAGSQRLNQQFCGWRMPIYRACDTLLPEHHRDPMRTGYVGRNSETELGSWAGFRVSLRPRPPSTVTSLEWFAVTRSQQYGRVQDSGLRRNASWETRPRSVFGVCKTIAPQDRDRSCPAQSPNRRIRDAWSISGKQRGVLQCLRFISS